MVLPVQALVPLFFTVHDTVNFDFGSTLVPLGGNLPITVQSHGSGIFGKRVLRSSLSLSVAVTPGPDPAETNSCVAGVDAVEVGDDSVGLVRVNVGKA